ncbi:uroporphyrinogen-III C-methyltransferase [Marinigracilibium pacificum]|uniref:uroporphyrinogen-III C-methyltransferase n=1 Tax=Marinigracilibium pacificum TaxID=2729599 RepID=A0A848J5X7_9BACT|nr:uroporphyrinogen-III C-methyltransferase [Marinigracilibium pacificum]NMM50648.1 uroporphyrinogen-III C-methyltransferase [Marinigracilibium pacificum]
MRTKLTLVGAGPGDPDLITLKGIKAIESANVILYDALVSPELLDYNSGALKIYVGKRAGRHSKNQSEINEMIIHYAFKYGHVVRLKGGDPFVFAHGKEEIDHAESFGIETAVIPGISSFQLPGLYSFPLTHRGISQSFTVVTATGSNGEISDDLKEFVNSRSTLVILMGMRKLSGIAQLFRKAGRKDLPVAVIVNGSLPNARVISGFIDDIEEKINAAPDLNGPGIIVAGESLSTHSDYLNVYKSWLKTA